MSLMHSVMWGGVAFGLTAVIVRLSDPLARRVGLVDHPVGRKDHEVATPATGGAAMLLAILTCGALAFDSPGQASLGFALSATMLVVTGMLDDRYDLSWWVRILVQISAALVLIYWGDARIENLGRMFGVQIDSIGIWSVPFTVFAVVGAINAVNMADGIDGLAGLLVLCCLALFEIEAIHVGNAMLAEQVPILIGAVGGFLLLNMRWPWRGRARVFMGNSGSAMLGLVVACCVIRLTQHPQQHMYPVLALWLLPVPLIDCLALMLHRLRSRRSPFHPDHNHVHHLMRDAGFSPAFSALWLAAFSILCWLAVHLALRAGVPPVLPFCAFVCLCFAWYWLTARRTRAVGMFCALRRPAGKAKETVTPPIT